jgi:hypothetical protein
MNDGRGSTARNSCGRLNEREQIRDSGGLPRRSDCFEAFSNSSTTTAVIIVSCFDDENDGSKLLE